MTDNGLSAMMDAAKALALTGADLLVDPSLLKDARSELDTYLENEGN